MIEEILPIKSPPSIEECRRLGRTQFFKILPKRNDIIAAYSDGSVARNDMIPGSDIDIGIIVENPQEKWNVTRIVDDVWDILIEWAFIPKESYVNSRKILEDAGFTHDIAHAYIYYDPKGFFEEIQTEILQKYEDKPLILKRAKNQINIFKNSIENIEKKLNKNKKNIYPDVVNSFKYSLGFPSALINQPVTNTRAFLFCKRACNELEMENYLKLVYDFVGSTNISREEANFFLERAIFIINKKLTENEKSTYLWHLKGAKYLIDNNFWRESIHPIFLWCSKIVNVLPDTIKENDEDLTIIWEGMMKILSWDNFDNIQHKIAIGKQLIENGSERIKLF
ncbi:MAG: nucleotidyltransferase domain-containing protein [Promethearchaeota archaeon]|jgi:predicted nucleotidyltransferase